MRILRFNESINDVLWKGIDSTEYVERIDRKLITFSDGELKYISKLLSKFKLLPPKSRRVTAPIQSFIFNDANNFGTSKDLKKVYIKSDTIDIEVIKDDDYNYFVNFGGGKSPYRFKMYFECDTLKGLLQCIESTLSKHFLKKTL